MIDVRISSEERDPTDVDLVAARGIPSDGWAQCDIGHRFLSRHAAAEEARPKIGMREGKQGAEICERSTAQCASALRWQEEGISERTSDLAELSAPRKARCLGLSRGDSRARYKLHSPSPVGKLRGAIALTKGFEC